MLTVLGFGEEPVAPRPEQDILPKNVSGGLEGPQAFPGSATSSEADSGEVDLDELFEGVNHAPDVQGSYSATTAQAYAGQYVENYGSYGAGYELPDQSLGVNRLGYRGHADEELPIRPPAADSDDDYDND